MFRRPNKPRSNASQNWIRRQREKDDDDDDNDPVVSIVRPAKKKAKKQQQQRTVVVNSSSLAHLQDDEAPVVGINNDEKQGSIQRLRDSTSAFANPMTDESSTKTASYSLYGSEAMARLKSEQQRYYPSQSPAKSGPGKEQEEEPVALLLSGEDAIRFMQEQAVDSRDSFHLNEFSRIDEDAATSALPEPTARAEEDAWEAQVARRAGLPSGSSAHRATTTTTTSTTPNLPQLRQQLDAALTHLQQQQQTSRIQERRASQIQQMEDELQRYEHDLAVTGRAHEYFQQFRHRLACWVGALRDLITKLVPLQDALYDLEAHVAAVERWRDWENDMASVLQEHDCLDKVLGRQPPPFLSGTTMATNDAAAATDVDEFGRSAQSQATLQRDKRYRRRQRIRQQRSGEPPPRGDESDALVSDNEQESFRERHVALQKALGVATAELDQEFTKLQGLVDDFDRMHQLYPEEYKQCFSSLSLADLAAVLIRVELCALNDPWNESHGYNEGKWMAVIRAAEQSGALDGVATERVIEKSVLPAVNSLVDKSGINLSSKRQMKSMGEFMTHVEHFLRPESNVRCRLRQKLVSFVQSSLDDIAMPIPKQTALVADTAVLQDAIQSATVGQMHRATKILTNLLLYWAPILQEDLEFADAVLDFISSKFIFLLSSLQSFDQPRFAPTPADAFREVHKHLRRTKWLERPEFMLQATPIRAAATVFGVDEESE